MQHILKNNLSMDYVVKRQIFILGIMMLRLYLIMEVLFTAWNRKMEPMLLNSQLADGSWPKEGSGKTSSRGGKDAGVYRTTSHSNA